MRKKTLHCMVACSLVVTSLNIIPAQAGEVVFPPMPAPGTMVDLSPAYEPARLVGMTIHPDNALKFDFLVNKGDEHLTSAQEQQEYKKLVKYFMATLTIPNKDQWVNLSPYENNRIIEDDLGKTEMGRELLAQDYLLKQITSSLMYPESGLGRDFWNKVYARAYQEFGSTSNIPVNTFNKVWIMPDEAAVYESGNTVYVVHSHLKVMLEEDYLSLKKHSGAFARPSFSSHTVASKIIREIILPALEKEVNEGKNFANLRQIVSGMILSTWYKKALKESLLGKVYADRVKIKGVDSLSFPNAVVGDPQYIYQQYLKAFKKGVYNFIKEDEDKYTHQPISRKYFAGGEVGLDPAQLHVIKGDLAMLSPSVTGALRNLAAAGLIAVSVVAIAPAVAPTPAVAHTVMEHSDKQPQTQPKITGFPTDHRPTVEEITDQLKIPGVEIKTVFDGDPHPLPENGNQPTMVVIIKAGGELHNFYHVGRVAGADEFVYILSFSPKGGWEVAIINKKTGNHVLLWVANADAKALTALGLTKEGDQAMLEPEPGGISLNADDTMKLIDVKRDGQGVPLPINQQDMAQLNHIAGFDIQILEIKPVAPATFPLFFKSI